MKARLLVLLEIVGIYALMQAVQIIWRATGIRQWEIANLGWTYTGSLIFVGIPAIFLWLARRDWATYGITRADWQTNLDVGIKAYLVRLIPVVLGLGIALWLGFGYQALPGRVIIALAEIAGIVVMLWAMNRLDEAKAIRSARGNLITIVLLLLFPLGVALAMGKLSIFIISNVAWQFLCSGFGKEFVWRGYIQSRLNTAFGHPYRLWGIQFEAGLVLASLSWGWALFTTFGGLFFGIIREKTGSLLGCVLAHGLPDAVGKAPGCLMGWM